MSLVTGEFGNGLLGPIVVDQRLACSGRRDERGYGGIVERGRQTETDLVQTGNGVVGNQRVAAPHERQMMAQLLRGFGQLHRC